MDYIKEKKENEEEMMKEIKKKKIIQDAKIQKIIERFFIIMFLGLQ